MKYRKWDDNYSVAEQLFSEIGTINVPIDYVYKSVQIGYWLSRQRTYYNQNILNSRKIELLERLGIKWDGYQNKRNRNSLEFSNHIQLLRNYYEEYGNTRVPQSYSINGFALGKWLTEIRYYYRHPETHRLTKEQIQMIESAGFEPNWYEEQIEANWQCKYQILTDYASLHSIRDIREGDIYKGVNIGNWLHRQRIRYNEGTLPEDQLQKLISIGVVFSPIEKRWEDLFLSAKQYYHLFGNLNVPDDFIIQDQNLGRWISYQRSLYNRGDGSLSEERIKRLDSIGMKWKVGKSGSSSFAEQAVFFYLRQIYPDTINRCTSFGFELDNFIPSLKFAIEYDGEYWHRDKGTQDNEKDAKCDSLGINLVRIREYPLSSTKSAKCYLMKSKYSHAALEEVIKTVFHQQLSVDVDANIVRDAFSIIKDYERYSSKSWYAFYELAKDYYNENGNLLIPAKYVTESGMKLGRWIQNQRQAYKGQTNQYLSDYEVGLLESIGMVWDIREAEWNKMFDVATDYYKEHGDLRVPRNCIYKGNLLGKWINTQRNNYSEKCKRKTLSNERVRKLESIGMIWNVLEYEWNRMYMVAKRYYEEYGYLNVPKGSTYQGEKLGDWVYTQKIVYQGKRQNQIMSEDRKRKLENIGIKW